MNNSLSPRPLNKPEQHRLPFELICRIIETFAFQSRRFPYDTTSDFDPLLYIELLRLRLVSKTWSQATVPFAFHYFRIRGSKGAEFILKNWSTSIYAPDLPYPVKRLIPEDLVYLEDDDGTSPEQTARDYFLRRANPLFMNQATNLIESMGQNLNELTLVFVYSCGVSPSLIRAVKDIKHLKQLNLKEQDLPAGLLEPQGVYDPNTLADLFLAIPNIETLTIEYIDLDDLELKSPALSKLRFFRFTRSQRHMDGIAHICLTAKGTLTIIEFDNHGDFEEAEQVLGPIKSTLEGLITSLVTENIPKHVIEMEFPNLRFIRTRHAHYFDEVEVPELFLTWPIFHTIRTLALDISYGPSYLNEHLKHTGQYPFHTTPNLRHDIFILRCDGGGPKIAASELVEALNSQGIQCHVIPEPEAGHLMDLDYKLNGSIH